MGAAPNQQISPIDRVAEFRRSFARAEAEIAKVIVGHREVIRKLLTALLAGGHVLIEGVPGLGKTLLVKTAAETLGLSFKRIQFTPDLMPSDIIGTQVLTETDGRREFSFKAGPIFAHVVLGDAKNPIGRAGGNGGTAGYGIRYHLLARTTVLCARYAKSNRTGRDLSVAGSANGSISI
jgi:ATPase family associated with various cellular activities (AAA)